jgi:hypothetical protein
MADDSGYYGSGVLTYNEGLWTTSFTESTEGFVFKEDGVEDGTPISQLSEVNILYGKEPTKDECPDINPDAELTIHTESGVSEAAFCGDDYSSAGSPTFKIMSVLPWNFLLYGGNYNMVLDSCGSSESCYVMMIDGCDGHSDKDPGTALNIFAGSEEYKQRGYPMTATIMNQSSVFTSCTGTNDNRKSGYNNESIGVFLLPSFEESPYNGQPSAPASRPAAITNMNTPILNGSRVAIAPPTIDPPHGGCRALWNPVGLPSGYSDGIYGDFVLTANGSDYRAEYLPSYYNLIEGETCVDPCDEQSILSVLFRS